MSEFEFYFEKMMNYYKCSTIKELGIATGTLPSTVSNWNQRQSISALKKKCRELGVFDDIFGPNQNNNFQNTKLSGNDVGVIIGSTNRNIVDETIISSDCGCDDQLIRALTKELCKKYKDDMPELRRILFDMVNEPDSK